EEPTCSSSFGEKKVLVDDTSLALWEVKYKYRKIEELFLCAVFIIVEFGVEPRRLISDSCV
ncbi:hypothetical protein CHUAL_005726, partial [Chamberlinius hualienensis]